MTTVDPFLIQQAEIRASRLVASAGFTRDDWEDLRQDLLLDYLERLPLFDSERGETRGFMFGVVRHRGAQLAAQQRRRGRFLADDGGSSRLQVVMNYDLRLDIAAVMTRLPEHLRLIAELLPERTPREVALVTGKSRSRVYQMIAEIRAAFEEAGVRPYILQQGGSGR